MALAGADNGHGSGLLLTDAADAPIETNIPGGMSRADWGASF